MIKKWGVGLAAIIVLGTLVVLTVARGNDDDALRIADGIASLSPNATEILFALGLQDRIVGVSTACDYPPEAKSLRKIGDFGAPRMDLIYTLKPALVIVTELRDKKARKPLEQAGVRLLELPQRSLEDVFAAAEAIGRAAGVPERAKAYVRKLRERARNATVDTPDDKRPRVYLELSAKPLRTAGKGSFIDDIIHQAGGKNIAGDIDAAWTTISPDLVIQRDPQIIIMTYGMGQSEQAAVAKRIGWQDVSAVKSGHVITTLNMDHLLRPGPRLIDGLEALADLFEKYRQERLK
jgi:cobalamin transport system substrate-binding protein